MTKKEQILELRSKGLSYREINKITGFCSSLIAYYCNDTTKAKGVLYTKKLRTKQHPFQRKINDYNCAKYKGKHKGKYNKHQNSTDKKQLYDKICRFNKSGDKNGMITLEEVQNKFGDNTVCYLTGDPINVNQPKTYQFDHKVPVSRCGDNSIDNLGICTKEANMAKYNLTEDEFVALCKKVLIHHGYKVEK